MWNSHKDKERDKDDTEMKLIKKFSKYTFKQVNLGTLALALYCYCKDTVESAIISKHIL